MVTDTPTVRRVVPVVALLVIAPWAAECSWGGFPASQYPLVVLFLAPLYGGAAVLIRETARRAGAGWPGMVLLAAAFGVYQAGLVDGSLFNPDHLADTQFADTAGDTTRVPVLGFDAGQAIDYVGNHIALSICAPIAVVEAYQRPGRREAPWLRGRGLAGIGVLFVLGSLLIHGDTTRGFTPAPHQVIAAVLLIAALVGATRTLPGRARIPGRAPHPAVVAALTAAAGATSGLLPGWAGPGLQVTAVGVAAAIIARWSRRDGWHPRHTLAAWGGYLLLVTTTAYVVPTYQPAAPTDALIGDIAGTVIAVTLLVTAYRTLGDPSPAARQHHDQEQHHRARRQPRPPR